MSIVKYKLYQELLQEWVLNFLWLRPNYKPYSQNLISYIIHYSLIIHEEENYLEIGGRLYPNFGNFNLDFLSKYGRVWDASSSIQKCSSSDF